jgi:type II secretory pathway pseudopilin PulG
MTAFSPTRRAQQHEALAKPTPQPCELERPHEPAAEKISQRRKAIPASEQGYVMLIAIFFVALLVISLAVAAPNIARSIQRDRDVETFHRGMQYRRAIQLYYRKFHAYPPNVEALVNTNDIRFLRKKYTDPITGQDDWKPIAFGQNKTPTAMGFFGQPLAGNASTLASIGPGGSGGLPGAATPGGAFGGSLGGGSSSGGIFGSSGSGSGQSPAAGGTGPTDGSGGTAGTSSGTDSSGTAGSSGSTSSGGTLSTGTGTGTGSNAPTFGGAGIIGFSPASPNTSILVYKKKQHYNEWEFTYDPLSDMQTVGGGNAGLVGQPASSTTTPVGAPTFGPSPSGPGSNLSPNPMPPDTTPQ